ncbi:MAG: glycerol-3-phosphate 1-O-acyltransferase PlsY [Acutalibacter sp.]|nr:glycerol-3-phosphate 1-O-acyltransferase PlsY [Acutalibacter sp.]
MTLSITPFSWFFIFYGLLLILCAAVGYLLGSINSSIILTKLYKKGDIREQGSGNAGMTNVLRSVGKLPAFLTFVGDFLKCVIAILLASLVMRLLGVESGSEVVKIAQYTAGVFCVMGHAFPLYYGFRGGKCIVTAAAMIALTDWRVFLLIISTFLILFIWKRIISLASITCAALYPVYTFLITFFLDYQKGLHSLGYLIFVTAVTLCVGVFVLYRHRSNIARLRRGEEKPITIGKKTG